MAEEPQPPVSPPAAQPQVETAPPTRRSSLAAMLPYLATLLAAVLISLGLQSLFAPRPPAPGPGATSIPAPTVPAAPTALPGPSPSPAPTAAPGSSAARGDDVLALQIRDLQEQNRELWSAIYLLRAAEQIGDAVSALGENDVDAADRALLVVYRSLDQAYAFSAEQEKGPIDAFRLQLSAIRDDLRVRPDGVDRRLRQLRQLMLSLVDEGG